MIYTLSDQGYQATVSATGAELRSYQDPSGEHYIWQRQPAVWEGSAPILFPIIGRLKDGRYQWQGQWYAMEKHGLVRECTWQLLEQHENELTLETRSNEHTLAHYPFEYRLQVCFSLQGPTLRVSYRVIAVGEQGLAFNLGSHPAFSLPLDQAQALSDYRIVFDQPEQFKGYRLEGGLLGRTAQPIAERSDNQVINLSEQIFEADALILGEVSSSTLTIEHRDSGPRVRLHTGGTPDLGIWAKPGANYVCLEPWFGHDDWVDTDQEFASKDRLITLAQGEVFETAYVIEICR